jgi:hypothetical protein
MDKALLRQSYTTATSKCDSPLAWQFEEEFAKAFLEVISEFADSYQGPQQDLDLFVYDLKAYFKGNYEDTIYA